MDLISISNAIQQKIEQLALGRKIIAQRAEEKAMYVADYEKAISIAIMRLKNGQTFEVDGNIIGGDSLPANLIDKLAKGVCWKERMDADRAEGFYRSAVSGMSSLEAELNGLQSIMRYMKEM